MISWITTLVGIVTITLLFAILYADAKPVVTTDRNIDAKTCESKTCGALDPVSDPEYNMKEIIKQSILLEQHLADKRKRCKDCILKHFLHCQGLAEEAVMLAGAKISSYPMMEESAAFYIQVSQTWLLDTNDETTMLTIEGQLRDWRKQLMAVYFLS
jgi:hypothetical protein